MAKKWTNRSWTGEDSSFYQSRKWRKLRKSYIEQSPVCELCGQYDIVSPGEIVDHIISRKASKEIELEPLNLQTVCNPCHFQKTARTRNIPDLKAYIKEMETGKLMHITPPDRKRELIEYIKKEGLI